MPHCSALTPNRAATLLACLSMALLSACDRSEPVGISTLTEPAREIETGSTKNEVELTPQQIEKLGLVTAKAASETFTTQASGYAVVLAHDVVAQSVADMETSEAALQQSSAALARVRDLADTPGAFSAEAQETSVRQAAADQASLTLAQRKLSAAFGQSQPWRNNKAILDAVANGRTRLIRATFSLGALTSSLPRSLRVSRLDPGGAGESWTSNTVWAAPADSAIPGRSVFALLEGGDIAEGERLNVWAPIGKSAHGVVVPQTALIASAGKYWCYVEVQPGRFRRIALDIRQTVPGGYFMEQGISTGDSIVIAGAGLLLAQETNPGTDAQ